MRRSSFDLWRNVLSGRRRTVAHELLPGSDLRVVLDTFIGGAVLVTQGGRKLVALDTGAGGAAFCAYRHVPLPRGC